MAPGSSGACRLDRDPQVGARSIWGELLKTKLGTDVRASGLQGIGRLLLVYTSAEGHSCIRKAIELLGLGGDNLRVVPVDAQRRLQVCALEAALQQALAAGHVPIAAAALAWGPLPCAMMARLMRSLGCPGSARMASSKPGASGP